jgi:hypothetical protein
MKTSVITFSRNDGYKEKERVAIHLNTLLDTFDEVNYVDWNSPTHSLLYDIMDLIPKTGRIKHFIIPPSVHQMYADSIPNFPKCFGPISFNLALRRTDADWVVATTTDNIPPNKEELHSIINNSDKDTFYTISRRETEYSEVLKNINNLQEYREYLKQITEPRYYPAKITPNDKYSLINCCGDFQLASRKVWWDVKGFEENMFYNCFIDTNVQKKVVLNGYKIKALFDTPMYHMSHKNILPQGDNTEDVHEIAKNTPPPVYNDPWKWVEYFTESQNGDNWGLADTEIEYEMI